MAAGIPALKVSRVSLLLYPTLLGYVRLGKVERYRPVKINRSPVSLTEIAAVFREF